MLHFIPKVKASYHSFEEIIRQAKTRVETLDEGAQNALKEKLNHGLGILLTDEAHDMYLVQYGEIHQAKLLQAFEAIPHRVWLEGSISVIDYGCGQAVAEMVLADFIKKKYVDNDVMKDLTLVELSGKSLSRAEWYMAAFYPDSELKLVQKAAEDIVSDDIRAASQTCLHIFSNVIDMPQFPIERMASLLNSDVSHNNVIVCVSPFYPEEARGARMDAFASLLSHYTCKFQFQKYIEDWDKSYSCQIRIFVSYYF